MKKLRAAAMLLMVLGMAVPVAKAHVGNKDVYETVEVGGYKLFVTVRTPLVIPGVATIEVRSTGAAVDGITVTPLLLTGEASKHPPTPDAMKRSSVDSQEFTGSLWLMGGGSYQVRFGIDGAAGKAVASVPVPAAPLTVLTMQKPMGILLSALGLLLVVGVVGIVMAAVREARLAPGAVADEGRKRRSMVAGGAALVVVVMLLILGAKWWNAEAADYSAHVYKASDLHLTRVGPRLILVIGDDDGKGSWKALLNKDLLTDHGHLMHLYAIRWPEMDAVYHLHPESMGKVGMSLILPEMPAGDYKLFGDIVYAGGFPETETAMLTLPAMQGPLGPDDASALPSAVSAGMLGASYKLPDGYSMVWDKPAVVKAETAYLLRFTLNGPDGKPAGGMQPYLGMAGHAAFVKVDGTAFAHTHPDGSAAMAAVMLADESSGVMEMQEAVGPVVEFPYGFPSAGRYRIFVQMKHSVVVETGVFDVVVE